MRNNYSIKVRNKKKGRKTTTLVKRRHMKGGNVAKNVLFIGVGLYEDGTDYLRLKQGLIANEINFATDNIYLLDKNMNFKNDFTSRDNIKGLIKYDLNDVDKLEPNFKFDDESKLFDIIILDYAVYYFIDINKLKKFFDKWLKPGGYFLIPDIIYNEPLSKYRDKVRDGSKFKLTPIANSQEIQINVKNNATGDIKPFRIHKGEQIRNIKRTILDNFNIPQEDLHLWRFVFSGVELDDNKLVEDYGLTTQSTIQLIEVMRPKYPIKKLQQIFSSYNCQALSYDGTVKAPRFYEKEYKLLKCTKNVTDSEQKYDYSLSGGRKITKKSKKRKSKSKKQSKKK